MYRPLSLPFSSTVENAATRQLVEESGTQIVGKYPAENRPRARRSFVINRARAIRRRGRTRPLGFSAPNYHRGRGDNSVGYKKSEIARTYARRLETVK